LVVDGFDISVLVIDEISNDLLFYANQYSNTRRNIPFWKKFRQCTDVFSRK
jgi:hypothetical protein